jgi:hydrogenase/urease accessory protein HupE
MNQIYGTAIYTKNVPAVEQGLRIAVALGLLVALVWVTSPWLRYALGAAAGMALLTGVFGFCPACYLAGRRLEKRIST